jgi:hypothetical protein
MSEGFDLVIRLNVYDEGEPGSLICFEHEGKQWCAYYIEPWEFMEAELREAGFPDNIIEFIYRFLMKYDRIDLPEDDEEEEVEEDWIL